MNLPPPEARRFESSNLAVRLMQPFFAFSSGFMTLSLVLDLKANEISPAIAHAAFALIFAAGIIVQTVRGVRANNRGLDKLKSGDRNGVLLDFDQALKIDSGNAPAANNRATLAGMV